MAERGLLAGLGATLKSWFNGPVGPINWTQNGGIPVGWQPNFWQQGFAPFQGGESATVNACVNAYAQTIAQLPGGHFKSTGDGGQKQVKGSPLAKILRTPNGYQTRSDFMLGLVCDLLFNGNAFAWAERDSAGRVLALHPVAARGTQALLEDQSGAIFYGLADAPLAGQLTYAVPQRDVLHIRGRTAPDNPLKGISPIRWAAMATAANVAITASQAAFFAQASQPSGFLSTTEKVTDVQMNQLREAWANRTQHTAAGQVPVLGGGMKFEQLTMTSQDAQLVEAFRMTVADIARAFGVPLPIIGDLSNATFNNTEQLIGFWLSTGLGFYVEHIEIAFDRFFDLPVDEFTELDTDVLLRTQFKERIEGLTKGIVGGLYSPNEARRKEGLPDAEDGDEPRLQAQVVPLSQVSAEPAPSALPAPSAPVPALPAPDPTPAVAAMLEAFEIRIVENFSGLAAAVADETRELRSMVEAIPPPIALPEPVDLAPTLKALEQRMDERLAGSAEETRAMIAAIPPPPEPAALPEPPEPVDLTPALEAIKHLGDCIAAIADEHRTLRTMIEAAEPAMDAEEADELALLQLRKAKETAGHAD